MGSKARAELCRPLGPGGLLPSLHPEPPQFLDLSGEKTLPLFVVVLFYLSPSSVNFFVMDDMSQRDSRLEELEKVDKDIIQLLTLAGAHLHSSASISSQHLKRMLFLIAGNCLQELSKEKPVLKTAELHSSQFLKTLENIDRVLIQQVSHLQQISTG